MSGLAIVLLLPFVIDLVLLALIAKARTCSQLSSIAVVYALLNVVGPLVAGLYLIDGVANDATEVASLIAIVAISRVIDLFGFRGLAVFRDAWRMIVPVPRTQSRASK
jgi:hypothetical protein